jgi:hypothetical protein
MALQPQFGIGVAIVVISVPLVARMVPRNPIYGVRTRKAFVSDRNWYEINAYGGRLLLGFGLLLCIFSVLAEDSVPPPPPSLWNAVFTAGPLVLIFPILLMIRSFSRRLPETS